MKSKILLLILLLPNYLALKADEGMWLFLFLNKYNIEQMQQKGFKLTAQDIYDANQASIKDAVVMFGKGCTGEIVSDKGLLLTNHHCGYGSIQKHSTLENDYLTNGFWAMSQEEELPNPGLTVTFLIYMEDVTERVKNVYTEKTPYQLRIKKIDSVCQKIETETELKHKKIYQAEVESFFYDNQFILIVSQTYTDVRLVGTPPNSIGKFGGDTDNWVWPRHTGDFSVFRIYADKNNNPAPYSKDNVPYKPQKSLAINIKGVKENDFTFVLGYPAYTQAYIPSYAVNKIVDTINPIQIDIRQKKLDLINNAMNNDRLIRIQYSAKQASIANAWKKWIGQNQGLKRIGIGNLKEQYEQKFQNWADTTKISEFYKNILPHYKNLIDKQIPIEKTITTFHEAIFSTDIWKLYNNINSFLVNIDKVPSSSQENKQKAIKFVETFYKDYNPTLDREIFAVSFQLLFKYTCSIYYPSIFKEINTKTNIGIEEFAKELHNNSILTNKEKLIDFINNYNSETKGKKKNEKITYQNFESEKIVKFLKEIVEIYNNQLLPKYKKYQLENDSLNHLYMQAQILYEPQKTFYPDANFTMRLSYGNIKGFRPKDGIAYQWFTTLEGVIEKDNPEIYDYNVPEKLKELYKTKDYGIYADKEDGKIHVCFIASNHTSGGNSGSPVLNADGQLIGINFDRCWESTMSDIKFDDNYCRNISLDIRYVLFIIDKYAGATYLLEEMKIIK